MAHLKWTPSLSVGNSTLDSHHKKLIDLINAVFDVAENSEAGDVGAILSDLLNYTRFHFIEEEMVMEEAQYPNLEAHRKTHAALAKQVHELHQKYKADPDLFPAVDLFNFLSEWYIEHISNRDMQYRPYL